jgi:high-affinity iron transporter
MLSTAIIVFREVLEITMILGIVLSATRGLAGRTLWVAGGLLAGMSGAALIALFAGRISDAAEGMGQELFNAAIVFTAAVLIGWTVVWMQGHAREMSAHLKQVGKDVVAGRLPLTSLAVIVGLAMLRECSEIVLFIYGMLVSGQPVSELASGTAEGLALGIIVGVLLYYGLLKIPARYTLKVTSWLLILLVAGLSAQGANFLSAAGYFPNLSNVVWDSSWLLSEEGYAGRVLHTLVGYSAQPTSIELIFYGATLLGLAGLVSLSTRQRVVKHAH